MPRPTTFPKIDANGTNTTTPLTQIQDDGLPERTLFANGIWNWAFHWIYQWIVYLDDIATTQFGVQHDVATGVHTVVTATSITVSGAGAIQQSGSGHIQATGSGDIRQTGTGNITSDNAILAEEDAWSGNLVLGGYVHVSGVRDTVSNTTSETTFTTGTVTLPAGYTVDGRTTARVRGSVHVTSLSGTPAFTVKLKFGSAVATFTFSSVTVGDEVTFDVQYTVLANGELQATLLANHVDGGSDNFIFTNNKWASYNSAIANDVEVTAQWGAASASNIAELRGFEVEVHKR